jgi:hypothetical protein
MRSRSTLGVGRGSGGLERVTPRIDSESHCHCAAEITWDEVYGWLHSGGAALRCQRPAPVYSPAAYQPARWPLRAS